MTGCASPCGACKFLRRKCVRGCVFAPYFCHEQGATHFAAIHKVFGASNVSKLLAHLPLSDRSEAALTIAYEAQARLQDPIYGCVSHIFALQQQIVNLQAQLASLKAQAAQSIPSVSVTANPNDKYFGKLHNLQDVQTWFHPNNSSMAPNFNTNLSTSSYGLSDPTSSLGNFGNSVISSGSEDYVTTFEDAPRSMSSFDMLTNNRQWSNFQDVDDLQAMAFGYAQHS
ncbi:hypothetical protein E1A91_D08G073900v1 [Gossypium mustelinum]|uniref:LOB domain-containing protein n=5 Tax=Gossypium TaxID=3633 RepID=A0A7J9IUX9_9ROSI|nr:hypothetical protein ES319_D08G072000v1 [Gossypium barbadense]MBA0708768.1 hypothetical protein [Gossypium laxum]MBA0825931.1 hypothetical protein [Gossypium armourianum]TYG56602.1 hypothetical protein ES288_D08G076600v1 [Gossypium darwinii]TYI68212.1 hypothetical protein E1A91_D08G073900v1 [Gossypium mustelinum]